MSMSITWKGKDTLGRKFKRAVRFAPKKVDMVIKNNGEELKQKVKEFAPKPHGSRYGANPYAEGFLYEHVNSLYGNLWGRVIAEASYAGYVNFGTRYMNAQPFFTDAYNWMVPRLEKDILDVIKGEFE